MTGFLSHLVDRAQGRAPLLERRPRALFEPERPMTGGIALESSVQQVAAPSEPRAFRAPDAPVHARADAREPEAPASARWRPPVDAAPQVSPPVRHAWPLQAQAPHAPVAALLAEPASASVAAAPSLTDRDAEPHAAATTTQRLVAHRPHPPVPSIAPAAAPLLVARAAERATPQAAMASPGPSRQSASPRREGPSAEANVPPTIHIAIGRVEVKAVSAGEAPRRAPGAAPRLSLDDYLRRRNGGAG